MKTWLKDLKVGDRVYVVPGGRYSKPYVAQVEKVGRKLVYFAMVYESRMGFEISAYIDQHREPVTVKSDYGCPSCIYRNEADYQAYQDLARLRQRISERIRGAGMRYPELTAEQAAAIGEILNLSEEEVDA